jgi:hypothetical protein
MSRQGDGESGGVFKGTPFEATQEAGIVRRGIGTGSAAETAGLVVELVTMSSAVMLVQCIVVR